MEVGESHAERTDDKWIILFGMETAIAWGRSVGRYTEDSRLLVE